ncbi:hypothetical protein JOM56_012759 [Amanita muscaria]
MPSKKQIATEKQAHARKRDCACGCGKEVHRTTEYRHLQAQGPGMLSLNVLVENPWAVKSRKKPSAKRSAKQALLGKSTKSTRKCSMKGRQGAQEPTPDTVDDPPEDMMEPLQDFAEPMDDIAAPGEGTDVVIQPPDAQFDAGHVLSSVQRSSRIAPKVSHAHQLRWGSGHGELTREHDNDVDTDGDEPGVQGMDLSDSDGDGKDDEDDEDDW